MCECESCVCDILVQGTKWGQKWMEELMSLKNLVYKKQQIILYDNQIIGITNSIFDGEQYHSPTLLPTIIFPPKLGLFFFLVKKA